MILASVLLIVAAVLLLALGLVDGSNGYLVASIAASLLAAMALIVSGRRLSGTDQERIDARRRGVQQRRGGLDQDDVDRQGRGDADQDDVDQRPRGGPRLDDVDQRRQAGTTIPVQQDPAERETREVATGREVALGDDAGASGTVERSAGNEPAAPGRPDSGVAEQRRPDTSAAEQRRQDSGVAERPRLSGEVYVIDGRPRYHLGSCSQLHGFEREAMPIAEALELGFTPCGRCEPDSVLLDRSGRIG